MNANMTGFVGLMMVGFELLAGFSSDDCAGCLDAPETLAAGSTLRYERWEECGRIGRSWASSSTEWRY